MLTYSQVRCCLESFSKQYFKVKDEERSLLEEKVEDFITRNVNSNEAQEIYRRVYTSLKILNTPKYDERKSGDKRRTSEPNY